MSHSSKDFDLVCEGSIYLLTPLTDPARAWVDEHLPDERQMFGNATVIEHRYMEDILEGIISDGLIIGRPMDHRVMVRKEEPGNAYKA